MASTRKIALNTVYLYIRLAFVLVVSLFTVRIVLGALGQSDYGVYTVVCGFVSMFGFLTTSMANAAQRFYSFGMGRSGEEAVGRVFAASLSLHLVLAAALAVAAEGVGVWYINEVMVLPADKVGVAHWLFQFSLAGLVLMFLQVPYSAAVVAYERMDFFALTGVVDAALKLAIAYAVYLFPHKLMWYGSLLMCASALNTAMFVLYARRHFRALRWSGPPDRALLREMLSFSGWNTFGSFAYIVRFQGVNVLMNFFFGVLVNAANGVAAQVSSALTSFASNLVIAFKPQLTQSYAAGERDVARELWYLMTRLSYALILTLSVPLLFEMDYILGLWLGGEVPHRTGSLASLIVVSVLLGCFHTPMTQIIHATGRMERFQIVTSCVILSILPLSWVCLMAGCPPESVYWVTIAVYAANQLVAMWLTRQVFPYSYGSYARLVLLRSLAFTLAAPLPAALLTRVLPPSFLRLALVSLATALAGACAAFWLLINEGQRRQVVERIKGKFNPS